MTKEVLLALGWFDEPTETRTFHERDLIKFFSYNVVIPKGTNPHPFSDVLHQWIEGAKMEVRHNGIWYHRDSAIKMFTYNEYRIKPQEPVYEWQWMLWSDRSKTYCRGVSNNHYISKEECYNHVLTDYYIEPLEETKRIRA